MAGKLRIPRFTSVRLALLLAMLGAAPRVALAQHAPIGPPRDEPTTTSPSQRMRPESGPLRNTVVSDPALLSAQYEVQLNGSQTNPPDPHGGAGPLGIMQITNRKVGYMRKNGDTVWETGSLGGFFAGQPGGGILVDPRALYDAGAQRFYVTAIEAHYVGSNDTLRSYVDVAVSKNSDPVTLSTSDWYFYRFDVTLNYGGTNYGIDYPGLAFDSACVYMTGNMFSMPFTGGETFRNVQILVMPKSTVLNGTGTAYSAFTPNSLTNDYGTAFTLAPVSVVGSANPANVAYFAEVPWTGATDRVRLWALSDPLGTRTLASTTVTVPNHGGSANSAPQCNTGSTVNTMSRRAQGNAFWKNGELWFCETGSVSGRAVVYFYDLATNGYPSGTPSLTESGSFDGGTGVSSYQPAIGANPAGDMAIVYVRSSSTTCPTIMYAARKAGSTGFATPQALKASSTYATGFKFGDYATVTPDPVDASLWVSHQWIWGTTPGNWKTQWGNLHWPNPTSGWPRAVKAAQTPVSGVRVASDGTGSTYLGWRDNRDGHFMPYAQKVQGDGSLASGWPERGVSVLTYASDLDVGGVVPDGAGGAYVLTHVTGFAGQVRLQRIASTGTVASGWPSAGLSLSTSGISPVLLEDGAGGAFVAWHGGGVKVQRVNSSGALQWGSGGVTVSSTGGNPALCSDGSGGIIVAWNGAKAQRLNSSGAIQWASGGLSIGTGNYPKMVADGSGGAVVGFLRTDVDGLFDLYASRINSSGGLVSGWTSGGTAVCTGTGDVLELSPVSDGGGGAIFAWTDTRNEAGGDPSDIYAIRMTGSGFVAGGWSANGTVVCNASGPQSSPTIVSDGLSGAVIAWQDRRSNPTCEPPACGDDLYALRLLWSGSRDGNYAANGNLVSSASGDQAKPAMVVTSTGNAVAGWQDGRRYPSGSPFNETNVYADRVQFDAVPPGAVTDLGLATGTSMALAIWTVTGDDGSTGTAANYDLRFDSSPIDENNFWGVAESRTGPVPGPAGTPVCETFTGLNSCMFYYAAVKIQDEAGNWSAISNLPSSKTRCSGNTQLMCEGGSPPLTTNPGEPTRIALGRPQPNPTSLQMSVSYAVPRAEQGKDLELAIYDLLGRRIRVLEHGVAAVGERWSTWDLRGEDGSKARSGIYFARLSIGSTRITRQFVVR